MKNFLKHIFNFKSETNSLNDKELIIEVDNLEINGFQLPKSVIKRIKNGKWKEPFDKSKLEKLIIEKCPFENEVKILKNMINDFTLFSLRLMKSESEQLVKWLHPKWDEERVMLLGKKDDKIYPGNIEPNKVILFADFGHGSDTCFALDYRENNNSPIVILEYWGENSKTDNRWKKIADSFEEFEQIIWNEK